MKNIVILMALTILSVSCSKKITYDNRVFDNDSIENGYNSYFTVEKTLISPKLPVVNNLITFHALDYFKKPISGLNVVITVDPDNSAPETLTLTEISTGIYQAPVAKDNNYALDIETNSIKFMTNRHIGNVIVVDNDFCYITANALNWTDYSVEGNGSSANPYKICTVAQLRDIALHTDSSKLGAQANDKNFILMNDVFDVAAYLSANPANEFVIAENSAQPFNGVLDGNNSKIINFKSTKTQAAFIKYVSSAEIKDLFFSYSYTNASTTSLGGFIYDIISSPLTTNIHNVEYEGNVNLSSQLSSMGGFIRKASSTSPIILQEITGRMTISAHGKIAGFISEIVGVGATQPNVNRVSVSGTFTNNDSINTTEFGGLTNLINNALVIDTKTSMIASNPLKSASKMAGIANVVVDGQLKNSYSMGQMNMASVEYYGGIVGEQTNSQITGNFTVVNATISSCNQYCGKTLGRTFGGINTQMGLYTSDTAVFNHSGAGQITIVESSVADSTMFYDNSNAPLSTWDFMNSWSENPTDYPTVL